MSGRFGKYGDTKRKAQIRKVRHTRQAYRQKLGKKKSAKDLRRRGI